MADSPLFPKELPKALLARPNCDSAQRYLTQHATRGAIAYLSERSQHPLFPSWCEKHQCFHVQGISKTKLKNYDVEEQVDAIVADNRTKAGWPHVVATLVAELPPEARPSDNALETLRKLYKKACDAIGDEEMYSLIRLAYQAGHTNPDVMSDPEKQDD